MREVSIAVVQRRLTHYRVPFFLVLREKLAQVGITLRLFCGEGTPAEVAKQDEGYLSWAEHLPTRYLLGDRLCWQPFAKRVAGSELVVVAQENGLIANHFALLSKPARRLAFWGHGANLQGHSQSFREAYKRWTTHRADWYFAYTRQSVDLISACGFSAAHITQLDNAIDMAELDSNLAAVGDQELVALRSELGLEEGPVGLFLGSLYAHKRIGFLIEAAKCLRREIDGFQLLIVGAGPEQMIVEEAASEYSWIKYVGPRKGREKAGVLKLSSILMNPGLVGLGVLDSFASNVPLVTTDCGLHSPEIVYLDTDNGVMSANNLNSYVEACSRLLLDSNEYSRLVSGCKLAATRYTLPNMAENFTKGVLQALQLKTDL